MLSGGFVQIQNSEEIFERPNSESSSINSTTPPALEEDLQRKISYNTNSSYYVNSSPDETNTEKMVVSMQNISPPSYNLTINNSMQTLSNDYHQDTTYPGLTLYLNNNNNNNNNFYSNSTVDSKPFPNACYSNTNYGNHYENTYENENSTCQNYSMNYNNDYLKSGQSSPIIYENLDANYDNIIKVTIFFFLI